MAKGPKGPSFRGGISEMMRYANRIQQKLSDMKEEMKDETMDVSVADGRVTATVNGERKVVKISIDREKVDLEDMDEVEDLVAAAVNAALEKMDEHVKEETKKITGGMDLPGLFFDAMIVRDVQDPLERLVKLLTMLPGIGERTARRLAFHVLRAPAEYPEDLAHALLEIRGKLRECTSCGNISEDDVCPICSDGSRDPRKLCVVASIQDLQVIERSGSHRGLYFVLHGYVAPLEGLNPEDLDTDRLLSLVRDNGIREVILATNPTVEGEATAGYLAQKLRDEGVKISRIASGIQHGAEIEYSDPVSVARAIDRRDEY